MQHTNNTAEKKEKKILRELDDMELPDSIKLTARDIYLRAFDKETRGKNRKRAMFFCIFNAYNERGESVDPRRIASLVGLEVKSKEISRAKKCGNSNYKPKNVISTPFDFLYRYCELLGKENDYEPISCLAQAIIRNKPELEDGSNSKPQHVAAAIIYYYYSRTNSEISKEKFVNCVGISFPTIQKVIPEIVKGYE